MTDKEFGAVIKKIKIAYGNRFQNLTPDMLSTWYECLGGLNFKDFHTATLNYIGKNTIPPTIADLKKEYRIVIAQKETYKIDIECIWQSLVSSYPNGHYDKKAKNIFMQYISTVAIDKQKNEAIEIKQKVYEYVKKMESSRTKEITALHKYLENLLRGGKN